LLNLKIKNIKIYAFRYSKNNGEINNNLEYLEKIDIIKKYQITIISSIEDIKSIKPNVTFICNPPSKHISSALKAALLGSHIFIEKPISNNLRGLKQLQKIKKRKNLKIFVGYQFRFHPLIIKLKKLLRENKIGKILSAKIIVAESLKTIHKYEDYRISYRSNKNLGGGVVLSQSHEIDYILWLFGSPNIVSGIGGKRSNFDIDVEDYANINLIYNKNKKLFNINIYMDFIQSPPQRTCTVFGTKGTIELNLLKNQLKYQKNYSKEKIYKLKNFERNFLFKKELKSFLNSIKKNSNAKIDLNDGIQTLKLILQIKKCFGNF